MVFWEIYRGKSKDAKTAAEIGKKVHLEPKRILEIATPLAANHLFEKTKRDSLTAYRKYAWINTVKHKIWHLATDKAKLAAHVTTRKPRFAVGEIKVKIDNKSAGVFVDVRPLTIDDIDNFSKVRSLKHSKVPKKLDPKRVAEKVFKYATANILGNRGKFMDWGGEKSDLYSSHLRIKGKRYATAIAFKGPATTGTLTPGKMGHNGDQIQRLFDSDAQVFLVQYEGSIDERVSQQMKALAVNKSVEYRSAIFYGIIPLEDSYRLRIKYPEQFQKAVAKKSK